MENYEEFIQRQAIQLDVNTPEETKPAIQQSSVISFYGRPILPPLVNKNQKEEIQRLKEAAVNVKNTSKSSRVSYVKAILDSVQLRKVPTFDEFTKATGQSSHLKTEYQSTALLLRGNGVPDETFRSHLNSPPSFILSPAYQMPNNERSPANRPLTSTACDGFDSDRHFQEGDLLESSHMTVLFKGDPVFGGRVKHDVEANTANDCNSLLPRVDKHSFMDVSHQALSSGYVTNETSGVTSTLTEGMDDTRSVTHGRQSSLFILSNLAGKTGAIISHAPVDGEVLEEECSDSKQTHDIREPVVPSVDGPYYMSLQDLLKKSQEHRRRQRLLRNQATCVKASEPEQSGEHNLSDKENEVILSGETVNDIMGRTINQKLDALKDSIEPSDVGSHVECINSTSTIRNSTSKNEKASNVAESPDQTVSTAVTTSAKSLYQSKGKKTGSMLPRPCHTGSKKFKNVPIPKFCLSPVRSKKSSAKSGLVKKSPVKTPLCVNDETGLKSSKPGDGEFAQPPARSRGSASLCRSMNQAEKIAQLELNLSSLKVLISDLESTLAESQVHSPAKVADNLQLAELDGLGVPPGDGTMTSLTPGQSELCKDLKKSQMTHVTSSVQRLRVPEVLRPVSGSQQPGERTAHAHSQIEANKNASGEKGKGSGNHKASPNSSILNRSYDVDTPSRVWVQAGSKGMQLTPEPSEQEGVMRAKRRLLMTAADRNVSGPRGNKERPHSITPKVSPRPMQEVTEERVRTLKEEEQLRQQKELLQSLAVKYQFLRNVSFPCPGTGSRLEDTTAVCPSSVSVGLGSSSYLPELTLAEFSTLLDSVHLKESPSSVPVCHRPLLAAVVKGFLTRRLLRTERVAQLIRTIKDTQLFLQGFKPHTPGREYSSRQDHTLQERVTLQLRSARYDLHDLFFGTCPAERMQVISWDRELSRERKLKRKENKETPVRGSRSLSAATRKALERKKMMLQKKAADKTKPAVGAEDGWTFVPNPRRVPKKTTPLRRR